MYGVWGLIDRREADKKRLTDEGGGGGGGGNNIFLNRMTVLE